MEAIQSGLRRRCETERLDPRRPRGSATQRRSAVPRRERELRELREEFCEERARLFWQERAHALQRWRALGRESPAAGDAAQATAPLEPQSLRSLHERRQRLEAVERALDLLTHCAYGSCLACSEPIPLAALRAHPAAPRCPDCESRRPL